MLVSQLVEELSRAHQDVPVILNDGSELKNVIHVERDAIWLDFGKPPKLERETKALILLDDPKDRSEVFAKRYVERDGRISLLVRTKNKGVAYNTYHGIHAMKPDDEDVIAIVDADDTIPKNALKIVAKAYEKNCKILATYGSYWRRDLKRRTKTSGKYKSIKQLRKVWHGSHLKTFKYKLFKHLKKSAFKDDNKKWFRAASDMALMIPLIEMAGLKRTKYIKKTTYHYCYRKQKDGIGGKRKEAKRCIFKKKPYKELKGI